ncbi:MAG: hypothetical protein WEC33_05990, partial [Dehalococcoidia bacterium]
MSTSRVDPIKAAAGRIGGFTTASRHNSMATTAKARATFYASFEHDVDPNGELPVEERQRRAEAARSAHFARLAM